MDTWQKPKYHVVETRFIMRSQQSHSTGSQSREGRTKGGASK